VDVVVVGGGQAGLATAFYLRRAGLVAGRASNRIEADSRCTGRCETARDLRFRRSRAVLWLPRLDSNQQPSG
jgi:glycine/D-amino acid oxidase-like deaminating enzyme